MSGMWLVIVDGRRERHIAARGWFLETTRLCGQCARQMPYATFLVDDHPIEEVASMRSLTALVATFSLLAACNGDAAGPEECGVVDAAADSPFFFMSASFLDPGESTLGLGFDPVTQPGAIRFEGFLFPGKVRIDGLCELRDRSVTDTTLRLMGFTITPSFVGSDGERNYSLEIPSPSSTFDTLTFTVEQLPVVEGIQTPMVDVTWRGIARSDPDTIEVVRGEDLELHLRIPEEIQLEAASDIATWSLEVSGSAITLSGEGVPPDTLFFPARFFPNPSTEQLVARLTYQRLSFFGDPVSLAPTYVVFLGLQVQLRWVVQVRDPP